MLHFIQVLAHADDVNLIGDDIRTIERNARVLLNACKDIGLAVNRENEVHGNRLSSRHDGCMHRGSPIICILSQFLVLIPILFKVHSNIALPSMPRHS